MRVVFRKIIALTGLIVAGSASAEVKPHPLFTDNMVLQRDVEVPVWGLADPDEEITVTLSKSGSGTAVRTKADDKGYWSVRLPKSSAGTDFTLLVESKANKVELKNVAIGDVWVCSGQSNMEWSVNASAEPASVKAGANNANLRLFTVNKRTATQPIRDQNDLKHFSKWSSCTPENVGAFSAVAYHFGNHLQRNLAGNPPIGLIHTSWGGTPAEAWTSIEALESEASLKYYVENAKKAATGKQPVSPSTPASLYNAMIHPLLPFPIKGAIWYQGESNAVRAYEYRTLFPTMIQDWRKRWGADFPFLCVQLAPWHAGDANGVSWPELREAQLLATKKLPQVGMAVITDAGDLYDIHPRDKFTVGTRLALCARGMVYGEKIVHSGPVYREMKIEGDQAVLSFDHIGGGLMGRYQTLNGFEICGDDREFYPAKAVIQGETIVVSSPKVSKPVAVRFGWKNYPIVNLYNRNLDGKTLGLPATPFRTDDFPLTTMPKK
jgi:sialate O-acetylesterase